MHSLPIQVQGAKARAVIEQVIFGPFHALDSQMYNKLQYSLSIRARTRNCTLSMMQDKVKTLFRHFRRRRGNAIFARL